MSTEDLGFGIDIGGSGIKGGIVDLATGELKGERYKIFTPKPSHPEAVTEAVKEVVEHFDWDGPVGVTVPCVVRGGVVQTAANIDKAWIGLDAYGALKKVLGDRPLSVLNDADAAGLAEAHHGAGKDADGVTILLTFGTGIGSAILCNGALVPNTELGHLMIDDKIAEHWAASRIKEDLGLSYPQWAEYVSMVLKEYERLFWPSRFVAGGGISRKSHKWIPLLTNETPVIPAKLLNTAGIVGAAMAAASGLRP